MKQLAITIVLGALATLVSARAAAATAELGLDEVVRVALEQHPVVAAAERSRAAATGDRLSAEGGFDPSLRARAAVVPYGPYETERFDVVAEQPTALWGTRLFTGWRYGRGDFAVYDGKAETAQYGEVRAGFAIPLLRDGPIDRRRAAIAKAELGVEIAGLTVEQQRIEIARLAAHRYWDWVAAGRRRTVARELLDLAIARDAALAVRVDRGDIPAFERKENERAIEQRTANLAAAQRALENASIELSLFLRDDHGSPLLPDASRLPFSLPEPEPRPRTDSDERVALEQRPEPRRYERAQDQARIDARLANNQKLLGLDVVVQGSRDLGPADPKLTKPELAAMVLVDVPLLNRVNEGRARAAQAMTARAGLEARFARDRVVAEVRDATSAIDLARERLTATRREVAVGRELIGQELHRFELGEGTLLLVNVREQALGDALNREVSALADYHKARASLRAARGEVGR